MFIRFAHSVSPSKCFTTSIIRLMKPRELEVKDSLNDQLIWYMWAAVSRLANVGETVVFLCHQMWRIYSASFSGPKLILRYIQQLLLYFQLRQANVQWDWPMDIPSRLFNSIFSHYVEGDHMVVHFTCAEKFCKWVILCGKIDPANLYLPGGIVFPLRHKIITAT